LARGFGLWAPVLAWMTLLFFASSRSDVGVGARIPDWITHGAAYLVLGVLLGRAITGGFRRRITTAGALAVVGLCTLYGVSDEFHQSFVPGRDASPGDVAKDCAGAAIAVWLARRGSASSDRKER
jgi:VanZ family protein